MPSTNSRTPRRKPKRVSFDTWNERMQYSPEYSPQPLSNIRNRTPSPYKPPSYLRESDPISIDPNAYQIPYKYAPCDKNDLIFPCMENDMKIRSILDWNAYQAYIANKRIHQLGGKKTRKHKKSRKCKR